MRQSRRWKWGRGLAVALAACTVCLSACAQEGETPKPRFEWLAEVGCGEFTTREPAEGEIVIDEVPFVIDKPGKYILTKDLEAPASCIAIQTGEVTLELNGHTLRYGMGVSDAQGRGLITYNSRQRGNIGHAGILLPGRPDKTEDFKGFRWNSRFEGIVIRNGKICDGTGRDLAYSYGIDIGGSRGALVENVIIEVAAPDTFGLIIGNGGEIHNVTIMHNGTHVSNRHQQLADIATGADCHVHHNKLEGGPQAGIKAGSGTHIHHNLIRHRATVTNCYGVQGYGQKNVKVHDNLIMPYNGRGIHLSEKSSGWEVHDNYVEVRETKNREYRRMQTHGIKLEGTRDSKVYNNVVLSVSSDGGEPTPMNLTISPDANNEIRGNTFIAMTINKQGAYAAYGVGSDAQGTQICDNTYYSNNVFYYVSPDGSRNATFRRCVFRKIDPKDETLFYMNRNYKKTYLNNDRFIDCVFMDGIDPRGCYFPGRGSDWRSPGDYTVGWSLALKVTQGGRAADGAVVVASDHNGNEAARASCDETGAATLDLPEFHVVYDRETTKVTVTEYAPYTVKVSKGRATRQFEVTPAAPMAADISLDAAGEVILTPSEPRSGEVGATYSLKLSSSGPAAQWRVVKGGLPKGLTLRDGVIEGTPEGEGEFKFTLQSGAAGTKGITLRIAPRRAEPFWRERAALAEKDRIPGRVGVHFDAATDR